MMSLKAVRRLVNRGFDSPGAESILNQTNRDNFVSPTSAVINELHLLTAAVREDFVDTRKEKRLKAEG